MTLQSRLTDLVTAIGADIKSLASQVAALQSAGGSPSLTTYATVLPGDITLVAATLTNICTLTLPVGTYVIMARMHVAYNGTGATVDTRLAFGTAAGTITGGQSDSNRTTAANQPVSTNIPGAIVNVTTAGTIVLQAYSPTTPIVKATSNSQAYFGATGMSALKTG